MDLQALRRSFVPPLPDVLKGNIQVHEHEAGGAAGDEERIKGLFEHTFHAPRVSLTSEPGSSHSASSTPLRVGVVLSGGQAPGGHNVIMGLYDFVKRVNPDSQVIGFLMGPHGLFSNIYEVITPQKMDQYRNMGGFDMIGSGRHKIETPEQFADSKKNAEALKLDGIVIIGGDDSNTNAALLAEYFRKEGSPTKVIGVPKTIDGDLKNSYIPVSFGFDTACRTYSEAIANLAIDGLSSRKYYHFVRLMGRAASNITLECALQTHPNVTLLGEEVKARQQNLESITMELADVVCKRAATGKNYGLILLPEGLVEFIPEMGALLAELNELMSTTLSDGTDVTPDAVQTHLSDANAKLFAYLPASIKLQMLADRDSHGNVQVSKIETEKLLFGTLVDELERRRTAGQYAGSFHAQFHFFGYEGRSGLPTDFDSAYCNALGTTAGALIMSGRTGLMSCVENLGAPVQDWAVGGVPLTMMMNMERRSGKDKPVIKKALVELDGLPYRMLVSRRGKWAIGDHYRVPGPIQYHTSSPAPDSKTSVDPLPLTIKYELLEEKAVGSPTGTAIGDAEAYRTFLEAKLKEGPLTPETSHDVYLYRMANEISDQTHQATAAALKVDPDSVKVLDEGKNGTGVPPPDGVGPVSAAGRSVSAAAGAGAGGPLAEPSATRVSKRARQ